MFNNKGGVGKTTLLCNLAGYMSQNMSMKVLL
jgi:cellulose biosynthesis protein BcsQ